MWITNTVLIFFFHRPISCLPTVRIASGRLFSTLENCAREYSPAIVGCKNEVTILLVIKGKRFPQTVTLEQLTSREACEIVFRSIYSLFVPTISITMSLGACSTAHGCLAKAMSLGWGWWCHGWGFQCKYSNPYFFIWLCGSNLVLCCVLVIWSQATPYPKV